jgi:signal transduction histidine kinase
VNPARRLWTLYALFLALGLGAMAWVTRQALRAEQAERQAQARAMVEDKVRLALWRMDSTMALFLTPETARPWNHYLTFHRDGGSPAASPMLMMDDPLVWLRFQVQAGGALTSPLVPAPPERDLARKAAPDPERMTLAEARLKALISRLDESRFRRLLGEAGAVLLTQDQIGDLRDRSGKATLTLRSPYQVTHGAWTPFWLEGDLLLGRQVWVQDREVLQGIWLDWTAVREILQSVTLELLPGATFAPSPRPGEGGTKERRMSSLPVKLLPGRQQVVLPTQPPSHRLLYLGWAMVLMGSLAGGWVLHRTLELGERRVAFASAVTHELRSPMTTFKLYTELLAKGMVPDPGERQELLEILAREADRLDHLVKNVLAFARLEAGREASLEPCGVADLLTRIEPRLSERAAAGGLVLQVVLPEAVGSAKLLVDPLLLEQMLFNLVDNAAKYAGKPADPSLRIEGVPAGPRIGLRVRDFGVGLEPADRKHLFRPFHKSAQKAARTAPGVGLGLALCRGVARSLGGDLILEEVPGPGASFLLSLPRA